MPNVEIYREAIVRYRRWLESESPSACRRFLNHIGSAHDPTFEGALGEALAWNWLGPRSSTICLNDDPSHGGVDFLCSSEGREYYAEVSTLTTENVTNATKLPDLPGQGAQHYGPLTEAVMRKVRGKAKQAGGLGKPYLLFIPTVHFQASAVTVSTKHLEQILLGSTGFGGAFDPTKGEVVGELHNIATLDNPSFFQRNTLKPIRQHMSAVLVGGFGLVPPDCRVAGVLHPDPLRPFDCACLPDACFGRLDPWPPVNGLRVTWRRADGTACDDETERARRIEEAEIRLRKAGDGPLLDEIRREAQNLE